MTFPPQPEIATSQEYLEYIKDWTNKVLSPLRDNDGYMMANYPKPNYLLDYTQTSQESKASAATWDSYCDSVRLILTDGTPSFVDASGTQHSFASDIASVEFLRIEATKHHGWTTPDEHEDRSWLMFRDSAGWVQLLLPAYGWDFLGQLKFFCDAAGWRVDLEDGEDRTQHQFRRDLESVIPGVDTCAIADVMRPLQPSVTR